MDNIEADLLNDLDREDEPDYYNTNWNTRRRGWRTTPQDVFSAIKEDDEVFEMPCINGPWEEPNEAFIFGLTLDQIQKVIKFYESQTGKDAKDL